MPHESAGTRRNSRYGRPDLRCAEISCSRSKALQTFEPDCSDTELPSFGPTCAAAPEYRARSATVLGTGDYDVPARPLARVVAARRADGEAHEVRGLQRPISELPV